MSILIMMSISSSAYRCVNNIHIDAVVNTEVNLLVQGPICRSCITYEIELEE